jgi:hypothetical protein
VNSGALEGWAVPSWSRITQSNLILYSMPRISVLNFQKDCRSIWKVAQKALYMCSQMDDGIDDRSIAVYTIKFIWGRIKINKMERIGTSHCVKVKLGYHGTQYPPIKLLQKENLLWAWVLISWVPIYCLQFYSMKKRKLTVCLGLDSSYDGCHSK